MTRYALFAGRKVEQPGRGFDTFATAKQLQSFLYNDFHLVTGLLLDCCQNRCFNGKHMGAVTPG